MAQAARLNLRMQKELKLLFTDPPPGASFPSLSADAPPSLSSIEAQIEGPEGTVYAGGFFKLKIQIPDRYPFQPPNVTLATPIYHPNIDTGGRICLDILNLPPKGAWQPSLNISTVLTSIGLLLSEPNPDDGLMQEASQEFKYNRQVFDQKARSMTEKFARIGACETAAVAGQEYQSPSLDCAETIGSDTSMEEVHHYLGGNKRFCGISKKLSLESSELDRERIVGKSVNERPSEHSERELESKRLRQEPCKMTIGQIRSHQDPPEMRKKLSLESSTSVQVNKGNNMTGLVSVKGKSTLRTGCSEVLPSVEVGSDFEQNDNQCDERSKPITTTIKPEKEKPLQPVGSKIGNTDEQEKLLSVGKKSSPQHHSSGMSRNLLPLNTDSHDKSEPHSAVVNGDGNTNGLPRIKHRKLGLAGRHFSSGSFLSRQSQEKAKIENQPPTSTIPEVNSSKNRTSKNAVDHSSTCSDHRQPLKPLSELSNRNTVNSQSEMESKVLAAQHVSCFDKKLQSKQETVAPSADIDKLIVLDSEDSDEDQRATARSRLSLARRRLKGKSKS